MALDILKGTVVEAKLWAKVNEIESPALDNIRNIASMPWVAHLAIMPDVHHGKGATVGSVIALRGAVSPAAVGVDIGCGMGAIKTNLKANHLDDSLLNLRLKIESLIPVGFNLHKKAPEVPASKEGLALKNDLDKLFKEFEDLDPSVQSEASTALLQIGTLGSGNHFIELCLDTEQNVWMMLHSGSRGIGNKLAKVHITLAKELVHNQKLPDKDCSVFLAGTPQMQAYRRDLYWAQRYAFLNRRMMFELYKQALKGFYKNVEFEEPILCHHNYVSEEKHFGEELFVTRKGAISARAGEMGIIPGSMGTKSYIVKGLGNPESLMSASHGAGRKMSRGDAKRKFTVKDLEKQTEGVECRKDAGVIDEIPTAYKNIETVMKKQKDLVEVVAELKQVMCIKG